MQNHNQKHNHNRIQTKSLTEYQTIIEYKHSLNRIQADCGGQAEGNLILVGGGAEQSGGVFLGEMQRRNSLSQADLPSSQ